MEAGSGRRGIHLVWRWSGGRPARLALLALIVIGGVLAIVAFAVGGAVGLAGRPGLCARCHAKEPEWEAWQASAHARVPCVACHSGANAQDLRQRIGALPLLYRHLRRPAGADLAPTAAKAGEICLGCHSADRRSSTLTDLRIPHDRYLKGGSPSCLHCHASVTADARMDRCVDCHRQERARTDCRACHTEPVRPLSHGEPGWSYAHGGKETGAGTTCLPCHRLLDRNPSPVSAGVAAVRATAYCQACHRQTPPGHDGAWRLGHGAATGVTNCTVCHGEAPGARSGSGAVDCAACHVARHPPGWERTHREAVQSGGMTSCFRCHSVASCTNCHSKKGIVTP